ncbi:MAG TPA: phytanoyl-CoA dioxygenase family protein [Chthonomonadaceae bacterium]|nr:phytanoyl-CoA dioxygenase family protein [Chthonomonadaceae bacterium]
MIPIAKPGPMTEEERFLFDVAGYLVIPDALTPEEVAACLEAARRSHAPYPKDEWRQLGAVYEQEPAVEKLIDHPSILPKARALFGDYFILQSSWCTVVPPGFKGGGYHQDGSGVYEFRKLATPTPLVQLRVGYFLTDQTQPNMGNMVMIPGSHNSSVPMPRGVDKDWPIREVICGKPGTALMFHQGVYHCGTRNEMDFHRYIQHMVYAPPWLIPSDRKRNDPAFLERTTPLRRALLGEWNRPEEPFGMGYQRPPFEDERNR